MRMCTESEEKVLREKSNLGTKICSERIYLRRLSPEDDLSEYIKWVNDPEVMRFTESSGKSFTADDLKEYISGRARERELLLGIFLNVNRKHIGNIKLGSIHPRHKRADIGIIIGAKGLWGQGFAAEAIKILTDCAFNELNLKKIKAGMYSNNIGSLKAFLKAGFKVCGTLEDDALCEGSFVDGILVERLNEGYRNE